MCWSGSKRGWSFQPGEEDRLQAGPAEAVIPRPCLPRIPRMPQWELGCGFPTLALIFCWNFRRKTPKLRKKGISSLFCDSSLPLKDTLLPFPLLSGLGMLLDLNPWEAGTSAWRLGQVGRGRGGPSWCPGLDWRRGRKGLLS